MVQFNSRHLEIRKKLRKSFYGSLKKRTIGEPGIDPGEASSLTADTPKRRESEQGSSAENESLLAECMYCGCQQALV